jgi:uncharacterized protein (TIGR03067 family)
MRTIISLSIFFTFVLSIVSCESPEDGQRDLEKLQGTWQLVSGVVDGEELPDEEVKNTQIIIKGNTFVLPHASGVGTSPKGAFIINSDNDPMK